MADQINIEDLATEINKALSTYAKDVVEKIDLSSERITKEAVKKLKATSPKKTGKYAKSWAKKTDKNIGQPAAHTVYNKEGWLTHLLEHGHAKKGGGRVEAIPHIRPAEEDVISEFVKEVEEAIRSAGG
jgi:vacuolar-type H+-ATPase subunit E/Vma4